MTGHAATIRRLWETTEARDRHGPAEVLAPGLVTRVEDVWPEPYEPPADRAHLTERF